MACIRIEMPKIGFTTSTWVPDEEWCHLSPQAKNAMIYRFLKNVWPRKLLSAQHTSHRTHPNYRWSEI
jgi:hypothetical protein